ncbi:hypothetical protein EJB05_01568, partial [Eragrostis curvula]
MDRTGHLHSAQRIVQLVTPHRLRPVFHVLSVIADPIMKKTEGGQARAAAAAAKQDLMCRLLEEGRLPPEVSATALRIIAVKTGIKWFSYVTGLVLLAFYIKVQFPWTGTGEQVYSFLVELLICLAIPAGGYGLSKYWDPFE